MFLIIVYLFTFHGIVLGQHPTCRPVFLILTFFYMLMVVNATVLVETRNYGGSGSVIL